MDNIDPGLFSAPERKSTVDMVIEKIKDLLISKKLKPGDRLPNELELTKSLSTSRGSIREAMKILKSYGVLEIKRGDGTYISKSVNNTVYDHLLFQIILNDVDKKNLIELRRLMETGIVSIIIKNATQEDIELIEKTHQLLEEQMKNPINDANEITKCDLAFHVALGKATKNIIIESIYNFTLELFKPSIEFTHEIHNKGYNPCQFHYNILKSIKARNLEEAIKAVEESIDVWVQE